MTPFSAQTQYKANGVVPAPAAISWPRSPGRTFPDRPTARTTPRSNADIIPSLGRPLSGGLTTPAMAIPLVAPQTLFEDRITRLDLRLSEDLQVQSVRFQINLDAYNVLNSNAIRAVNSTYGSAWRTPLQILDPRLIQIGGQLDF